MKMTKRVLSIVMAIVTLVSFMGIAAEAASLTLSKLNLGYMAPTNSKGTKTIETVKLYGDYDYINFYINSKKKNSYFFYEIYSDKDLTKGVESGYVQCDKGEYSFSQKIKLKGNYKTKTYYLVTYAAKIYSDGSAKLDKNSLCQFNVKVDRSPDFDEKMLILKSTKNTTKGAYITWSKLSGATKYYVYRRSITGTKWTKVGTTKKTSFTDTSVKNKNGNYIYTVKGINKKGAASRYLYSGLTCLFAKTPVVSSIAVTYNNAVQIKWKSTSSKAKYTIMRKEGDGKWKTIKSNYSGTSYKDTTAKNGKTYTYSVKAVISTDYGKATSSYYANADKAVTYLKSPALNEPFAVENGVNVSWKAVSGAKGYTILRKNLDGSTGWSSVGKVDADVISFIDESADTKISYVYSVRSEAVKNKGSYNRTGIDYVVLDKPVIKVEATSYNEVKISWNEVPYATDYELYCRPVGGEWDLLDVVDSTCLHYLYDLNKFGDFEFSVRAARKNKNFSEYADAFAYYQNAMVLSSSVVFTDGVEIGWADHGYDSYNVYRRLSTEVAGEEVLIGTVTGNTFKDTTVENDVAYKYIVIGVIDGEEKRSRTCVVTTGIATTIAPPQIPKMRVVDDVLEQSGYSDVRYAYNFKYGYWDVVNINQTKEYYEDFIQDGKMKLAFSEITSQNLKTPIDSTIIEKEWFDNKIDFTTEVKNNRLYITCKSLSDNIEHLSIGSEELGVGTYYYPEGADTITVSLSLPKNETLEYCYLEIEARSFEDDWASTVAKITL